MASVTLAAYTVRIRKRRSDENLQLGRFNGAADLLPVIRGALQLLQQTGSVVEHDRVLAIDNYHNANRELWGFCRAGTSGYGSSIVELESGLEMYARRINDAELLPLGFHFSLPATANEGICLFQGFNRSSAKTLLCNYITDFFQRQHAAHVIRFNPLIPEQLLTEYLEHGRVVAARFVKFSIPRDIADAYGAGHDEEEQGSVELIVRARRRGIVNIRHRIQEAVRGGRAPDSVLELDGYDYDTTKIELDIGGKHRTIDLGELQRLRPTVDVTGDVEFGRDGHPDRESMVAVMRGYSQELAGAMGLVPHVS